jgi:hypothetical protein
VPEADGRLAKLLLGANLKIQIVSASIIMHMLTDKFVEPSMNQAHAQLLSVHCAVISDGLLHFVEG